MLFLAMAVMVATSYAPAHPLWVISQLLMTWLPKSLVPAPTP